jgi:phosphatidylserine/phosphatidylglycerophosphate/cardiolipin synthase-like enzyme
VLDTPLTELVHRYQPASTPKCPTFVDDSHWSPTIDGITYFRELAGLLAKVGPGDAVHIAGLQADPDLDLAGLRAGDSQHRPFTDVLAEKAADGADVRVLLSGAEYAEGIPWLPFGPFRANIDAARRMRAWQPTTRPAAESPLADRVLIDWSGSLLGTNHQKMVLFRHGDELTAYLGGLDLALNRYDADPHDRLRLGQYRWGWHDGAVRLQGPAAQRVWEIYRTRWHLAAALPRRWLFMARVGFTNLNPEGRPRTLPPAPVQQPRAAAGMAIQVLRSYSPWKIRAHHLLHRRHQAPISRPGTHEVYEALTTAIEAADRYIYLEDQYFYEVPGGNLRFALYAGLRAAAKRGVKVILVGSGRRDPADGGRSIVPPVITRDLRYRVLAPLPPAARQNVVMHRIQDLTVHTKLMLADDVFACIGSANFFSRSMVGTDSELSCSIVTTGAAVRDLRVALWAEHLRTPVSEDLAPALADLDIALGIWRAEWLPATVAPDTWRTPGSPEGFVPRERVLVPARYSRRPATRSPRR